VRVNTEKDELAVILINLASAFEIIEWPFIFINMPKKITIPIKQNENKRLGNRLVQIRMRALTRLSTLKLNLQYLSCPNSELRTINVGKYPKKMG
jgi:hypothetical protein